MSGWIEANQTQCNNNLGKFEPDCKRQMADVAEKLSADKDTVRKKKSALLAKLEQNYYHVN